MWAEIRQKIVDVITDRCTKYQVVCRTDQSKFSGYPAIVVSPSESQADYYTNADDKFIFTFNVQVHRSITEDIGQEQAEMIVEEVLDELFGIFKDHGVLAGACDWVDPVPSQWMYSSREDGQHRIGILKLKCVKFA